MFDKNPHSQIKAKCKAAKGNAAWHTKPARRSEAERGEGLEGLFLQMGGFGSDVTRSILIMLIFFYPPCAKPAQKMG